MKIKITTDSVADLTQEMYQERDIDVIPLLVHLGDNEYRDGVNICPEDIYKYVETTKKPAKTSAISFGEYEQKFKEILNSGYDAIIHISLSSEMSVTHLNAKNAAAELENVYVVDSKTLSSGVGLLVLYACDLRDQGLDVKTIYEKLEKRRDYVQASFVLDHLDYLHKGGRCSAVALFGANLLKIKPCIEVKNGKMDVAKKYFGKFEKSFQNYVNDILDKYNNIDTTRIFVTHTEIDPHFVEIAKKIIEEKIGEANIIETTAGATITCHCGKNTIGILYFNDNEK